MAKGVLDSIFGGVLGNLVSPGGGKYETAANALELGGKVVKAIDADDKGVDDAAGEIMITTGHVLRLIPGQPEQCRLAIAAAREALNLAEKIVNANVPPRGTGG